MGLVDLRLVGAVHYITGTFHRVHWLTTESLCTLSDPGIPRAESPHAGGDFPPVRHQGHRTSSSGPTPDRLLLGSLPGAQELRKVITQGVIKFKTLESVSLLPQIQNAFPPVDPRGREKRGLPTISRLARSLPARTYSSRPQELPEVQIRGPTFPVLCDAHRTFICAPHLYQAGGGGGGDAQAPNGMSSLLR